MHFIASVSRSIIFLPYISCHPTLRALRSWRSLVHWTAWTPGCYGTDAWTWTVLSLDWKLFIQSYS